jgi:ATP-dependent DNA helicase MPH1
LSDSQSNLVVVVVVVVVVVDIGEVDLIVNFDCLSSPIRMIQRIGRTARKRIGRVVFLLAKGDDEKT